MQQVREYAVRECKVSAEPIVISLQTKRYVRQKTKAGEAVNAGAGENERRQKAER